MVVHISPENEATFEIVGKVDCILLSPIGKIITFPEKLGDAGGDGSGLEVLSTAAVICTPILTVLYPDNTGLKEVSPGAIFTLPIIFAE